MGGALGDHRRRHRRERLQQLPDPRLDLIHDRPRRPALIPRRPIGGQRGSPRVPVEFLAVGGRVNRCFLLDDRARAQAAAAHVHGYAVQLTTLLFIGGFLADPTDTPTDVMDHLAEQVDIAVPREPRVPLAEWSDSLGSPLRSALTPGRQPRRSSVRVR